MLREWRTRGTGICLGPEQYSTVYPNRRYGTALNTWQIAKCMYNLMCRGRTFDKTSQVFYVRDNFHGDAKPENIFLTTGWGAVDTPYSSSLRNLILHVSRWERGPTSTWTWLHFQNRRSTKTRRWKRSKSSSISRKKRWTPRCLRTRKSNRDLAGIMVEQEHRWVNGPLRP